MQPAIKMALRVARQGSDYLKAHFERQEPTGKDDDERRLQLDRVEQSIYDNFAEQLEKAWNNYLMTVTTRLIDMAWQMVIGTRWVDDDFIGSLLQRKLEGW
ncbi:hypothetical protein LCGC14_1825480, partial [marine sediment metagenome]